MSACFIQVATFTTSLLLLPRESPALRTFPSHPYSKSSPSSRLPLSTDSTSSTAILHLVGSRVLTLHFRRSYHCTSLDYYLTSAKGRAPQEPSPHILTETSLLNPVFPFFSYSLCGNLSSLSHACCRVPQSLTAHLPSASDVVLSPCQNGLEYCSQHQLFFRENIRTLCALELF